MKIKDTPSGQQSRPMGKGWFRKLLAAFIILGIPCIAFIAGVVVQKKKIIGDHLYHSQFKKDGTALPSIWYAQDTKKAIANWMASPFRKRPPALRLHIKQKNFQKLRFKQSEAIRGPVLMTSTTDFVPAEIEDGDKTIRANIRLKGDWTHHIHGDKWSYRVKLKGESTLHGVKVFSLHAPMHRNHLLEWLFHRALRREGLIALRYHFHELFINGESFGIYAFEEHFDKRLIENNKRREGPILKFDETDFWQQRANLSTWTTGIYGNNRSHEDFQSSQVDSFQTTRLLSTPEGRTAFAKAATLLEGFRTRQLTASRVFEAEQMARYFALVDLFGATHGVNWINNRYYLNPVSGKLEPIGFDGNGGPLEHPLCFSEDAYARLFFKDPELVRLYTKNLERVTREGHLEKLLDDYRDELAANEAYIQIDEPGYGFPLEVLHANRRKIREILQPHNPLRILLLQEDGAPPSLQVANAQALPVEILGIVNGNNTTHLDSSRVLQPTPAKVPLVFEPLPLPGMVNPDTDLQTIKVRCRIKGCVKILEDAVDGRWHRRDGLIDDPARKPPNAQGFPELFTFDEKARTITLNPGSRVLRETIVLPRGYTFRAIEPAELDLRDGASLISYSPLHFIGAPEKPVRILSGDGSGGGLAVLDARNPSTLKGVIFENLANPGTPGWNLTGAVTFYKSPVTMEDTTITKNRCEDALNIFDSHFTLRNIRVEDSFADGFDADFSNGTIADSTFVNTGNDAIDVSGGNVSVTGNRILNAGDKGISAGERSSLDIHDLQVTGALIGIASKDSSRLQVSRSSLRDCRVTYAAYQKKSEFGPGFIRATGVVAENYGATHVLEENSTILVDEEEFRPNVKDAVAHLYGNTP